MCEKTAKHEKNTLMLAEINQLHSVVKDFSGHSLSIKKLSITIYITFLSLFFAIADQRLSKLSFFTIGLSITLFCYFYEIYIDYVRQITRRRMENKIIEYETYNDIETRASSKIIIKFFVLKIYKNENNKLKIGIKNFKDCNKLYVNIVHSMYIIYLFELIVTILLGVLEVQ